jgi:hypothetical protein
MPAEAVSESGAATADALRLPIAFPAAAVSGDVASAGSEMRASNDRRMAAAQSVAESRHFAKSPLLSKFLLYVVTETIEGRQEAITEHEIGVKVFGRPASYRTMEDNIVRNYARQLRKRLAEHFAEAHEAAMRIEIPVGGYVPVFTPLLPEAESRVQEDLVKSEQELKPGASELAAADLTNERKSERKLSTVLRAAMLLGYSAALVALTALIVLEWTGRQPEEPSAALWRVLLSGPETTYVVPPDAGFNLVEDISHRSLPLAEYMHSRYNSMPLPQLDAHSAADLRSQQLTDFVDVQLMVAISRLKEYDPTRVRLRFPRDLRLDDLKNANALLIGSVCSNPWAAVKDAQANFTIVCNGGMQGSAILNRKPRAGEAASYASQWNEPTHATYALISFLPNLSGSGHLLLLEGLDVAGTQAAAEALLESEAIAPILRKARRGDGSLKPFEVLLKATSIEANATDTQVIASRIDGEVGK